MPGYAPSGLRVAVTRRILWVGNAAYPLATVARVSVTTIVPNYGAAIRRFLKFAAIVCLTGLGVLLLVTITNAARSSSDGSNNGAGGVVVSALILLAGYFGIDTLPVLLSRPLHAMAVDTAGPPTALVAWKRQEPAFALANAVTEAIENPQAEFQQLIQNTVVDMRRYHHGDNVNIYGGQGNTGVSK
ncbi:DUF6232 family protein [Kitasatospora sp. NPDC058965]|uniref:DUF6232 family protein n=1 Tax=Kitasatospora sp. NPDC058965 TaxID=3346682 RepID=UPI00367F2ECD